MKISVNDHVILELNETQLGVLGDEISKMKLEEDLKRRIKWVLTHKYENCFARLKKEWEPKLVANGITSFPADKDEFAQLVFSQEDYKDEDKRVQDGENRVVNVDNGTDLPESK